MKRFDLRPADFWWRARSVLWPEEICRNPPPGISCTTSRPSARDSKLILELSNAKVAGEARILATQSDVVIANMQGLVGVRDPLNHHFLEPKLRIPKHLSGRSFIIAGATEPNYYHWLFDCLPRLHLAHCAGIDLNLIEHFLLMRKPPPFVAETLALLEIPRQKWISLHSKEVLQCDTLFATKTPLPADEFPAWVLEFLTNLLGPKVPPIQGALIYLSRNDAQSRRVTNDNELSRELGSIGFETVLASGLSVREQAELFASARLIVSSHGAGLANILFSAPGTTVVELYSPAFDNVCFQRLGNTLKQRFMRIKCVPAERTSHLPPQEQDMEVPIKDTLNLIRREIGLLRS